MSIRQAIAAELRRMDDPVWVEVHPWETISDAGKYRYLREADAVLAAIAQDAVVIERDRWKRVSNAVRSFKQAEQEDANMDDAVYCHVCMDAVQPNDLDPVP